MRIDQKKTITAIIADSLHHAGAVYLTDFTGLDVEEQGELRSKLRESGAAFRVVKNTLAIRALEGLELEGLEEHLRGPTGLVLAGEDPVAPAKVVRDFAKEHDNKPVVRVGVVDMRTIGAEDIAKLADLPGRDALLGSIAGALTSSAGGIVGVLAGLMRDIAYMVEEAAKKREGQD
ncbi:MAG: 50S ribosomal protein L10 [Gemmatimonadota bacterium]